MGYDKENREPNDFYKSPAHVIQDLLHYEFFDPDLNVWESACGDGVMSKELRKYFRGQVLSTDIIDRGYEEFNGEHDFLQTEQKYSMPYIITNPPYKVAQGFIERALQVYTHKAAFLLRINFLESARRYELFKGSGFKGILVYTKRITCVIPSCATKKPTAAVFYAWFIWEKGYIGLPTIKWINPERDRKV